MKKEQIIGLFSTSIGEGNPLAVRAAQTHLRAAGEKTVLKLAHNPLTMLAAWKQGTVTADEESRVNYNQNYDQTRNSLPAKLLGLLNLFELTVFLKKTKATKLILAQELPLTLLAELELPIISAIIKQLEEIIILVPDVYPKKGAFATVQKLQNSGKNVTLAVWNTAAQERLQQAGVRHHLIKPWLIPEQIKPLSPYQAPVSMIRPSGTGVNPAYLVAITHFLDQKQPHRIGQHLLGSKDLTIHDRHNQKKATHHRLHHSLSDALIKALQMNPEIFFAYPSEMVQVITQFRQSGWNGKYFMFPERGLHEVENGIYAAMHGLGQALTFTENRLEVKKELKTVPTDPIDELVGHQPLNQVLR